MGSRPEALQRGSLVSVGRSWCAYHVGPAFHVHVPEAGTAEGHGPSRTKSQLLNEMLPIGYNMHSTEGDMHD
jgi:hypothetical protein